MANLSDSLSLQAFKHVRADLSSAIIFEEAQPHCVWTNAHVGRTSWRMCVYGSHDLDISNSIRRHGCYECAMVGRMLATLRRQEQEPRVKLVDLGGNIGTYTLAAAAAGFDVDVFEPVPDNARYHQGMRQQG